MSFAAVQRILGILLTVFSLTLLPPFVLALLAHDGAAVAFATAFALTLGVGILSWLPVRGMKRELRLRDGFIIVVMFWTVLTSIFLCLRLAMALHRQKVDGSVRSWFLDINPTSQFQPLAVKLFTMQKYN